MIGVAQGTVSGQGTGVGTQVTWTPGVSGGTGTGLPGAGTGIQGTGARSFGGSSSVRVIGHIE